MTRDTLVLVSLWNPLTWADSAQSFCWMKSLSYSSATICYYWLQKIQLILKFHSNLSTACSLLNYCSVYQLSTFAPLLILCTYNHINGVGRGCFSKIECLMWREHIFNHLSSIKLAWISSFSKEVKFNSCLWRPIHSLDISRNFGGESAIKDDRNDDFFKSSTTIFTSGKFGKASF